MRKLHYIVLVLILLSFVGTIGLVVCNETAFAIEIDPVSSECLSCHEDMDESEIKFHEGHVTGLLYKSSAERNGDFHIESSLPLEMVLHEGKITCATCHGVDPHDGQLLVIDNSESALCVSCHKK